MCNVSAERGAPDQCSSPDRFHRYTGSGFKDKYTSVFLINKLNLYVKFWSAFDLFLMVLVHAVFNEPIFCFTLSVSDVVQPENLAASENQTSVRESN